MAWTNPPTFSTGAVLTAAQLNILSDDVEFLYGKIQAVNVPFSCLVSASDLTSGNNGWRIIHRHRYLHYRMSIDGWNCFNVSIYVNGTQFVIDSTTRTNWVWSGYLDLNPLSLTNGTQYEIYLVNNVDNTNLSARFKVEFLGESDSTTI